MVDSNVVCADGATGTSVVTEIRGERGRRDGTTEATDTESGLRILESSAAR